MSAGAGLHFVVFSRFLDSCYNLYHGALRRRFVEWEETITSAYGWSLDFLGSDPMGQTLEMLLGLQPNNWLSGLLGRKKDGSYPFQSL